MQLTHPFIKAYSETRTPPCEGCHNFNFCKFNRLACGVFKHYVSQGDKDEYVPHQHRTKHPSRKFYNDIFTDFSGYDEERQGK